MRINQNISAMNTYSRLTSANNAKSGSLAKLSSGLRINKAGDDAAGLAISEKMRGQIGGLNQGVRNAQDGISLIQTAEGALSETHSILNRMRELAVQSANGTNTADDRGEIQKEMNELTSEINRVGNTTEFNTQKLLQGGTATGGGTTTYSALTLSSEAIAINSGASNVTGGIEVSGTFTGTIATDAVTNVQLRSTYTHATTSHAYTTSVDGGSTWQTATPSGGEISLEGLTIDVSSVAGSTGDGSGEWTIAVSEASTGGGTAGGDFSANLQIGANSGQSFELKISDMRSAALGISDTDGSTSKTVEVDGNTYTAAWTSNRDVTNGSDTEHALDVSTFDNATAAIGVLDEAISEVSSQRSALGAAQNRLDHTINNLTTTSENLSAAESRIRDVDMAQEMMEFTKNNILSQAATSMLAQANQMPQSVLQLLQ